MTEKDEIKLVKCPNCEEAFYIRTKLTKEFKLRCPFCEQKVKIKINGRKES